MLCFKYENLGVVFFANTATKMCGIFKEIHKYCSAQIEVIRACLAFVGISGGKSWKKRGNTSFALILCGSARIKMN
jgi:hypothetical protein